MTGLKASRDKLLAEVDRQSREIERLLYHNATLEQVTIPWFVCTQQAWWDFASYQKRLFLLLKC